MVLKGEMGQFTEAKLRVRYENLHRLLDGLWPQRQDIYISCEHGE